MVRDDNGGGGGESLDFGKRAKQYICKNKNSKLFIFGKKKNMQKVNEGQHHECRHQNINMHQNIN